jgi:plastocyanin
MSQQRTSIGVPIAVAAVIIISLAALGYYQFVYLPSTPNETRTTSQTLNIKTVQINMTEGSAAKFDDAYTPNPAKLVIGINNSIIVFNDDKQSGGVPHTLTDRNGGFDTGIIQYGEKSKTILIDKPGTYNYFCVIHPTTMRGQIVVTQGSGSTQTTETTTTTQSSPTSTAPALSVSIPNGAAINQKINGYEPATVTVKVGANNTVTWTNNDGSPHTVTARDRSFDSKNMNAGDVFTFTFTKSGTFEYFCLYHPWMKGTVVVKS